MFATHSTDRLLSEVLAGLAITVVAVFAALTYTVFSAQTFV